MFVELGIAFIEINPLVIKENGDIYCLDAKEVRDDNAAYRQPKVVAMNCPSQDDAEIEVIVMIGEMGKGLREITCW